MTSRSRWRNSATPEHGRCGSDRSRTAGGGSSSRAGGISTGALTTTADEVARLRRIEDDARHRLAAAETATRISTTSLSIAHDRARKRAFSTQVRYARVATPALTGPARRAAITEARQAVGVTATVSRLPLVLRGTTGEVPSLSTQVVSADIVITYTSADRSPALGLSGRTLGMGGSWPRLSGEMIRLAGFAAVDVSATSPVSGGRSLLRAAVLLHELGHAIGLSNVTDRGELMHPRADPSSRASFGRGDLNGLQRVRAYSRC